MTQKPVEMAVRNVNQHVSLRSGKVSPLLSVNLKHFLTVFDTCRHPSTNKTETESVDGFVYYCYPIHWLKRFTPKLYVQLKSASF